MSSDNDTITVFGSTNYGFVPRQLADIQRGMNQKIAQIVDPRTGEKPFQNETDDTVVQQMVAIFAEATAEGENAAAAAFNANDPLTAVGAGESSLVQLNAMLRRPGSYTIIPLEVVGVPSTLIPAGSQVSGGDMQIIYETIDNIVLPQSGKITSKARCRELGPFKPDPDTVAQMITPVPGWESAVNRQVLNDGTVLGVISVGTDEESDEEVRRRQQTSTSATSYRQIEAIEAGIGNIPGVTFRRAYQNRKLKTDKRGIPGKSIACVVVGGDSDAIAREILYRSPEGAEFYGDVHVTIYDAMGIGEVVSFSRPYEREISVRIDLTIVVDESLQKFPTNGEQGIKEALIKFAEEGSSLCEPMGNSGFNPGQDIIRPYLYTPINSIGGAKVTKLELAVDGGEFAEQDIKIAWNEIGIFDINRITINRIEVESP